jgi:hypothetical protein
MRRILLVAACAVAFLVASPAAGHATVTPSTGTTDQLTGVGTLGQFGSPTAYLGAVGTRYGPFGAFTITYPDGTYVIGTATCLTVSGKIAYLTGRIALSGGPRRDANGWVKGNHLVVGVEDNSEGGVQQEPDRLNFSAGLATNPGCGPNGLASPDFFIVRGNYRVVDGG